MIVTVLITALIVGPICLILGAVIWDGWIEERVEPELDPAVFTLRLRVLRWLGDLGDWGGERLRKLLSPIVAWIRGL